MREETNSHCSIYESTFLKQSVEFFEDFRIGGRYWWVPDRRAIGEIGNDKRVIQCEKNLRRGMLRKVTVDSPNSLTSIRANRLDVGIESHLRKEERRWLKKSETCVK